MVTVCQVLLDGYSVSGVVRWLQCVMCNQVVTLCHMSGYSVSCIIRWLQCVTCCQVVTVYHMLLIVSCLVTLLLCVGCYGRNVLVL